VAGWIIIRVGATSGGKRPQLMLPRPPPRIHYRPTYEPPSPSSPEPVRTNLARLGYIEGVTNVKTCRNGGQSWGRDCVVNGKIWCGLG
jgi:hypothetical protein